MGMPIGYPAMSSVLLKDNRNIRNICQLHDWHISYTSRVLVIKMAYLFEHEVLVLKSALNAYDASRIFNRDK